MIRVSTVDQIERQEDQVNLVSGYMSTMAFVLCLLFVSDKPKTPPSISSQIEKESITSSLKKIFRKKKNFLDLLALSICIVVIIMKVVGLSWSYVSVISVILTPFHYS